MSTMKIIKNFPALKLRFFMASAVLLLLVSTKNLGAQTIKEEDVLVVADEMPSFPGGAKALIDEVYKNVVYPEDALNNKIEGKVVVRFIITKDGKAVQPSISKGLCPSIDKEVLRVITKLSKFNPAKTGGVPVNVWYALPITFKINQSNI